MVVTKVRRDVMKKETCVVPMNLNCVSYFRKNLSAQILKILYTFKKQIQIVYLDYSQMSQ